MFVGSLNCVLYWSSSLALKVLLLNRKTDITCYELVGENYSNSFEKRLVRRKVSILVDADFSYLMILRNVNKDVSGHLSI